MPNFTYGFLGAGGGVGGACNAGPGAPLVAIPTPVLLTWPQLINAQLRLGVYPVGWVVDELTWRTVSFVISFANIAVAGGVPVAPPAPGVVPGGAGLGGGGGVPASPVAGGVRPPVRGQIRKHPGGWRWCPGEPGRRRRRRHGAWATRVPHGHRDRGFVGRILGAGSRGWPRYTLVSLPSQSSHRQWWSVRIRNPPKARHRDLRRDSRAGEHRAEFRGLGKQRTLRELRRFGRDRSGATASPVAREHDLHSRESGFGSGGRDTVSRLGAGLPRRLPGGSDGSRRELPRADNRPGWPRPTPFQAVSETSRRLFPGLLRPLCRGGPKSDFGGHPNLRWSGISYSGSAQASAIRASRRNRQGVLVDGKSRDLRHCRPRRPREAEETVGAGSVPRPCDRDFDRDSVSVESVPTSAEWIRTRRGGLIPGVDVRKWKCRFGGASASLRVRVTLAGKFQRITGILVEPGMCRRSGDTGWIVETA